MKVEQLAFNVPDIYTELRMDREQKKAKRRWEDLKDFDAPKKPLANDYVPNPWREWEKKAYLKGSMHE